MKTGLCLSGGGARGAFHIGVLQAIDDINIQIDIIAGCSAGALIGTLYGAGVSPKEILALAVGTKWMNFFKPSFPNKGIMGMDYLIQIMGNHVSMNDFSSLKIPVKVVATNITKGKLCVFESGELFIPVVASCCIPLLFKPIMWDEDIYLDGGILMNLPASIIRKDCKKLIGVNLMPLNAIDAHEINSSYKIINRILELSVNVNSSLQASLCDVLIESPAISAYSRFDLKSAEVLFELGYQCGLEKLNALA